MLRKAGRKHQEKAVSFELGEKIIKKEDGQPSETF